MDYEKLKTEINAIVEIVSSVPQQFKDKCFEMLLSHLIGSAKLSAPQIAKQPQDTQEGQPGSGDALKIPAQVRVFMTRMQVTEEELNAVVMSVGGEVHFVKEPKAGKVAAGQIKWTLLTALKNGLSLNNLVVDPEDVRSICVDKGYYDKANFAANFKAPKSAELFKGELTPQGQPQGLTTKGEAKLAALIKELAGQQ